VDRAGAIPTAAVLVVPSWLWGRRPSAFFSEARLHARLIDDRARSWSVQTDETYRHARPDLITVWHLAGPAMPRPRFDILQWMVPTDTPGVVLNESIVEEMNRLEKRAEETGNPADALAHSQLQIVATPSSQVADVVRGVYENLLQVGLVGDSSEKVFANAGVHVFRRESALIHRLKLASVWLRVLADEMLRVENINHLQEALAAGDNAFASSEGLYDGIYTLDAYIGPLLGALSPAIWSFHATRSLGAIVYTLGQPISGTTGSAAELLHVLPHQGSYEATNIPSLSPRASVAAVDWWAEKLNYLFAVLGDLAVFTDQRGLYVPSKHLHALLTVEQLFRRVASVQTSHRDANARRTLMFTVLDTLERLTGRGLPVMCSLPFAQKTYNTLAEALPAGAAEVLLPAASRALISLEGLQDGFFIARQEKKSHVEWADPRGGFKSLTAAEAAAQYIKVLRDSTHGHGSNRPNQIAQTDALLTHHNGRVPHDLALLGYLYLLDLLNRPEDLRKSLYQGGIV
jgi:hypothetical protein